MKKSLLILSIGIALVLGACSKEQQTVNKLEGSWNIVETTLTEDGVTNSYEATGVTITYDKCKLSENDWCTGLTVENGDLLPIEYKVINDGATVVTKYSGSSSQLENTIEEISKTELILSSVTGTVTYTHKFEKLD